MKTRSNWLFIVGTIFFLVSLAACVSRSSYQEVEAQLARVQQEKAGLEEKAASLTSDLTKEQSKLAGINTELGTVQAEAATLKTSLSGEQARARALAPEAGDVKTLLSLQEFRVSELSKRASDLETSLNREKDTAAGLRTRISKVEGERVALGKEVENLKSNLAALAKTQLAPTPAPVAGVTFVTYRDDKNGFAIDYPGGWAKQTSEDTLGSFMDLRIDADVPTVALVAVTMETLPVRVSVSQYWDQNKASFPLGFDQYAPVSTTNLSINGIPAIRHTFTARIRSVTQEMSIVILVKDKRAWLIVLTVAPPDKSRQYAPIFNHIIQSFKQL